MRDMIVVTLHHMVLLIREWEEPPPHPSAYRPEKKNPNRMTKRENDNMFTAVLNKIIKSLNAFHNINV